MRNLKKQKAANPFSLSVIEDAEGVGIILEGRKLDILPAVDRCDITSWDASHFILFYFIFFFVFVSFDLMTYL